MFKKTRKRLMRRPFIRYKRGGTALPIQRMHMENFLRGYQIGFDRKANSKYIKYQHGGALPLLAMAGKAIGKVLLKLLANEVLN